MFLYIVIFIIFYNFNLEIFSSSTKKEDDTEDCSYLNETFASTKDTPSESNLIELPENTSKVENEKINLQKLNTYNLFRDHILRLNEIHWNENEFYISWKIVENIDESISTLYEGRPEKIEALKEEIKSFLSYLYAKNCYIANLHTRIQRILRSFFSIENLKEAQIDINTNPFLLKLSANKHIYSKLGKLDKSTLQITEWNEYENGENISWLNLEIPLLSCCKKFNVKHLIFYKEVFPHILKHFLNFGLIYQENETGRILYEILSGYQAHNLKKIDIYQSLNISQEIYTRIPKYLIEDFYNAKKINVNISKNSLNIQFRIHPSLHSDVNNTSPSQENISCYKKQNVLSQEEKNSCAEYIAQHMESLELISNQFSHLMYQISFHKNLKFQQIYDFNAYIKSFLYDRKELWINKIPKTNIKNLLLNTKPLGQFKKLSISNKGSDNYQHIIIEYTIDEESLVKECLKNLKKYLNYEEEKRLCSVSLLNHIFLNNKIPVQESLNQSDQLILLTYQRSIPLLQSLNSETKSYLIQMLKEVFRDEKWLDFLENSFLKTQIQQQNKDRSFVDMEILDSGKIHIKLKDSQK